MSHSRSEELFRRAIEIIPGGVNSPVRKVVIKLKVD